MGRRLLLTLGLVCLLFTSLVQIKNTFVGAIKKIDADADEYNRSPNCNPRADIAAIDQSLPPCIYVPATVLKTWSVSYSRYSEAYGHHVVIDHYVTLEAAGNRHVTFIDDNEDQWNILTTGMPVEVQMWRSTMHSLYAGGYTATILNDHDDHRLYIILCGWGITAVVSSILLRLTWWKRWRTPGPPFSLPPLS